MRNLAINTAANNHAVQLFKRLTVIAKLRRQPIEQFGVRRQLSHSAKVVRRVDKPAAEVIAPNSVNNRAPSERMIPPGQPLRKRRATIPLRMIALQIKPPVHIG